MEVSSPSSPHPPHQIHNVRDYLHSTKFFYTTILIIALIFNLLRIAQIAYSKVNIWRKIAGFLLEFIHNFYISGIIVTITWLNLKATILGEYNVFALILVNIGTLFAFLLYGFLRTCLFFLFFNRTLGFHDCGEYFSIVDVYKGQKVIAHGKPNCDRNNNKWLVGIRLITLFMVILDIIYLEHFWQLADIAAATAAAAASHP